MLWPDVDLIVINYGRFNEIQATITALEDKLIYPREHLRYLIADDGTPGNHREMLADTRLFQRMYKWEFVPGKENLGWGGNANRALAYSTAPYIFQIEDDYVLTKMLDLQAAIATMEVKQEIGMMRFRGTAGDHMVFHQMEADITQFMPNYHEGLGLPGKVTYFLFDSGSPGLYLYSHGCHLKRKNFHDFYGKYPEGLKLGETEESYAHTVKDRMRSDRFAPVLAIQPAWIAMFFDHIGVTYQHTELDAKRV